MKKNKGITLIALVITIIVLLILAAVSIAMLTGENGILTKASTAGEKNKEAEAKEKVELILQEYAIQKYTENANFGEFLKEKKKSKDIDEYEKGTEDIWTIEVDGYAFDVNEKTLKIENYGKAELRPKASINIITEGYVLEGSNVQFKIKVTLPEELTGATITIIEPATGVTKSEEIYTVFQNGSYEFTIKANKAGKEYTTRAIATIDRILGKPTLSITDQQSTSFTINITNNYPQEANIQYVYYVGTSESEKITKKTYKKEGVNSGTKYTVKVRLYISDTIYVDSDEVQAETKGIEIRTVEDLKNIANNMAGSYQLMNDIDISEIKWEYILGKGDNRDFSGVLDGNGFSIIGMNGSTGNGYKEPSLFHEISGKIKNLGLKDIYVGGSSGRSFGGLAYTYLKSGATIENVYMTGKVHASNDYPIDAYYPIANGLYGPVSIENFYVEMSFEGPSTAKWNPVYALYKSISGKASIKNVYMKNIRIANVSSDTSIENAYYNTNEEGTFVGTRINGDEVGNQSKFTGLDFSEQGVWKMTADGPKLKIMK